ncbi:MAG: 2-amino-4-hydroxy-6-hydroxymethyldihydropteridine diphosphokinase [Nitrospirae bacterium]|nr:MAG: 2-amino-4-hydroxy-6-hydroxymethyldihydropteridine diphosphokinase [Nitrospirota bacterium]
MIDVYIGVGSNLGDRRNNCQSAVRQLKHNGIEVIKVSPVYETEPWGVKEQPPFLNLAIHCRTSLPPEELLRRLKDIEKQLGRESTYHWGPRTIDLDILFYGDRIVNQKELVIPHPHIAQRLFVLKPLSDIAPFLIHPVLNRTILELLQEFKDKQAIHQVEGL